MRTAHGYGSLNGCLECENVQNKMTKRDLENSDLKISLPQGVGTYISTHFVLVGSCKSFKSIGA